MTRTFLGAALLAGAATLSLPAFAHHPSTAGGSGGSGPINVFSATTLGQGQSAAAVMFEAIKLDPLGNARLESLADADIHAHSLDRILSPSLVYAYGLTSDLTISARLPVVVRQDIREGHHHMGVSEVHQLGDAAGIGDLTLLGQYRFLNDRVGGTEAAILFGVKAPTGRTGVADDHGERFAVEFQPGSGSWDGLLGAALSQRAGAFSFHASALYMLVREGAQDTDLGDRLNYGVAVSYRLGGGAGANGPMYAGGPGHSHGKGGTPHVHHEAPAASKLEIDLVLELNGEWSGKQREAGVRDDNSGGHTLYLSPGIRLSHGPVSGFASVGLPVINELNGVQAEPAWRLLTGIAMAF